MAPAKDTGTLMTKRAVPKRRITWASTKFTILRPIKAPKYYLLRTRGAIERKYRVEMHELGGGRPESGRLTC